MKRLTLALLLLVNLTLFAQEYDELLMVSAINELRMNPNGFIPHIEAYINKLEEQKENGGLKFTKEPKKIVFKSIIMRNDSIISEAKTLISILKTQKKLNPLQFNTDVYPVTKNQVNYPSSINKMTHNGPNNQHLYDRMKGFNTYVTENCISINEKSIYECIVVLLIDFRVKNKQHRHNLLDEKVNQISVAKCGNYWVQNFIKN